MNIADVFVVVILGAAVAAAVIVMFRNRKKGKNFCGGDCVNCTGCVSGSKRKKL